MGDCAESGDLCVPQPRCPETRPYSCSDGSCVVAVDLCPLLPSCPSGFFMCSNGKCMETGSLCPTLLTCPPHTVRCLDSSCRLTTNVTLERRSLFGAPPDYSICVQKKLQESLVRKKDAADS